MAEENEPHSQSTTEVSLAIRFVPNPSMRPVFSNNVIIQQDQKNVFIQFFEIVPPLLTGNSEENHKTLQALPGIDAYCVAKVVIGLDVFESMSNAVDKIRDQLNRQHHPQTNDLINEKTD